jgi:hypothetical protein
LERPSLHNATEQELANKSIPPRPSLRPQLGPRMAECCGHSEGCGCHVGTHKTEESEPGLAEQPRR